ncbi:MAG: CopD family protein [Nitrospirota bacterium]
MSKWLLKIYFFIFALTLPSSISYATVEYARQTGLECKQCHVEAIGGSPLTKRGEKFLEDMKVKGLYRPLTKTQRVVRFFIGYLHLLTAIAWFGTILYVHIILKPVYAVRGLPKAELFLGWISIIILLITGILLSIARIPSWKTLYMTKFGILLSIKTFLFLIMLSTALVVTFFIGPKLRKQRGIAKKKESQDLTLDELSQFDGKEGKPAYIVYKGAIYDVTKSKFWEGGSHAKKHLSGQDLTDAINTAPHGEEIVLSMPCVGRLVSTMEKPSKPFHERLFYFFAYMNLVIVFLIVFVIALWRWG